MVKNGRMWEWWRAVEREYREKRRHEDEQREQERRERGRRRTPYEAQMEARKYASWTTAELLAEVERQWGIEVEWEEFGIDKPRPRGMEVVVEIGRSRQNEESRLQKCEKNQGREELAEGALLLVLTGRFRSR